MRFFYEFFGNISSKIEFNKQMVIFLAFKFCIFLGEYDFQIITL